MEWNEGKWAARQVQVRVLGPKEICQKIAEYLHPLGLIATGLAPDKQSDGQVWRMYCSVLLEQFKLPDGGSPQ